MLRHRVIALLVLAAALLASATAFAWYTQKEDGSKCEKDDDTCYVYCNNHQRAGSMNWNGSVWTDGIRSDRDMNVVAKAIVAANGTACQ